MNVQCKAMSGLLAAGGAVTAAAPAGTAAANAPALSAPAVYSTAGLFRAAAQSVPLNIPRPPAPARFPRPSNYYPSI